MPAAVRLGGVTGQAQPNGSASEANDDLRVTHGAASWTVERPQQQPRERRRRMAEHLLYEIEACNAAALLLASDGRSSLRDFPKRSKEWWGGNAYAEAFLLHVRPLDEFFYKDVIEATKAEPPLGRVVLHSNDVTALTFVRDQQEWLTDRPPRPDLVRRAFKRINRTILHLSWQRLSPNWDNDYNAFAKGQEWPVWDVWDALQPTIKAFLQHADDTSLCDGFRYFTDNALSDRSVISPGPE